MPPAALAVTLTGGPTVLLELGGTRLLVDPTFDPPGDYPLGGGRVLTKTAAAARTAAELGPVDAVLLSHDQHPDNLDTAGRVALRQAPVVLTTELAAERLGGTVRALPVGATVTVGAVQVTGAPARHGPDGAERLAGPVTGFVLHGAGLPTVYVSGDNAALECVDAVAEVFPKVDVAILFAGAARTALFDGAPLTLTGEGVAAAVRRLGAPRVIVVHVDSWAHFSETRDDVRAALAAAGLADRLVDAPPGVRTEVV
ncbi:L-ascorbate metabolism protein UlaG, beta-lactamase superfamily [Modestobacter sp. DSM 44400]|uniref:MBL fold metallo-hydrolase n=1 Tax=Modestobacter sp. DSM 44400 TaxID=1550230 RepID=UPI00089B96B7|nr:MBL fold metallo-hydrolase [Modestobacter sp. DSM 44400]SDY90356.1 L-ascorbate metabolism protein UlaG, beta-lactamase superfamily [Modestobacter sp. DSM 44400]